MNDEKEILSLADNYKVFEKGAARLVYVQNSRQQPYEHMFGFWNFSGQESENTQVFDMLHSYLKSICIKEVVGPINYCTWLSHRIAMDNFDTVFYPDRPGSDKQNGFLKNMGYRVLQVSAATLIDAGKNNRILKKEIKMSGEFCCKRFHGEDVNQVLPAVYNLSSEIFSDFLLYSPLSYDDYLKFYIDNLKDITPDIALFFYNEKPIGYAFGYVNPDKKCYIGKTMGVLKQYRSAGMTFKIVEEYIDFIKKYNMDKFAFHYRPIEKPILDGNAFGGVILKKHYGLYIKKDI